MAHLWISIRLVVRQIEKVSITLTNASSLEPNDSNRALQSGRGRPLSRRRMRHMSKADGLNLNQLPRKLDVTALNRLGEDVVARRVKKVETKVVIVRAEVAKVVADLLSLAIRKRVGIVVQGPSENRRKRVKVKILLLLSRRQASQN